MKANEGMSFFVYSYDLKKRINRQVYIAMYVYVYACMHGCMYSYVFGFFLELLSN